MDTSASDSFETMLESPQPQPSRKRRKLAAGSRVLTSERLAPLDPAISALWPKIADRPSSRDTLRVLVTPASPHAGATTVALATAAGLAQHLFSSTILVESNFSAPKLSAAFDLPPTSGFRPVLEGRSDVGSAIVETAIPFLYALPAGYGNDHLSGAFARPGAKPVLEYLKARFTHVVFDAPSLLECPDARLLLDEVDAAIVVAGAGRTQRHDLRRTLEVIARTDAELLGVVLNRYAAQAPAWLMPSRDR
ncbi:MAG: hypothetical protein KDC38_15390 [Planctomycetes bacterium]|nr:hypothetical protein [Planctomycetota bacterium]